MGNAQSRNLYWKLHFVLPDVHGHHHEGWFDKKARPFASDKDREQFIHGVITVITQNGKHDLRDHSFRLLFSRRDNDRMVARILAEKNGVIDVKVEPEMDGKDYWEAFKALRKDVEVQLERILVDVSNDGPTPASSRVASPTSTRASSVIRFPVPGNRNGQARLPIEAPPAYGIGDPRGGLHTPASSILDISTNASQETLRARQSKDTL